MKGVEAVTLEIQGVQYSMRADGQMALLLTLKGGSVLALAMNLERIDLPLAKLSALRALATTSAGRS